MCRWFTPFQWADDATNPERLDTMKKSINDKVNGFTVNSNRIATNVKNFTATNAGGRIAKDIARQFDRDENWGEENQYDIEEIYFGENPGLSG